MEELSHDRLRDLAEGDGAVVNPSKALDAATHLLTPARERCLIHVVSL
jgi:hypothetical protein